ncbi:hypothetical protein AKJ48_01070 [candidate division MSBL1 archaeon SCGC-AAA261O19]|uniref:Transposase IS4-like domain-containing protein n=2 Tax=candidate division MSBL1 TaxID=215777 RepID=A0A133UY85_9EURY|nr:hypothetical protein AKJ42_03660 [candidate division MSBL1 archaeon SCGC-AAA261C02]KXB04868.1 hypothetical protein AKJ48_01070 [candidate division MSBL1 archaeon SCGC-AAA261O19]
MTQSPGGDNTSSNPTRRFDEPAQDNEEKQRYKFEREELRNLCQAARRIVYPEIKMNQHHNAEYSPSQILDVLTHAALTNDYTTNGSKTYGILGGDSPHPNSILYRVRKLELQEILNQFNSAVECTIREVRKRGMLRGRIDLAIDTTEWLYYGDENDPMVVKTRHRNGTNKAYRFATVNILINGERFTLKAIPMTQFTPREKILGELLDYAEKIVRIGIIYVDRAFFTVDCIRILQEKNVKFLMPAIKNKRVKGEMMSGVPRIVDFEYGVNRKDSVKFKLVVVEDEEKTSRAFATNLQVETVRAQELFELYSKRWGIETSYRVKSCLRPKTTSKNYEVRLFYFMFSVCLYNLWVLVNLLAGTRIGKDFGGLLVTAKMFCAAMCFPASAGEEGRDRPPD